MSLYDRGFGEDAVSEIFSPPATVQRMLDVEAALAQAEARIGLVPDRAAQSIVACCRAELIDQARLVGDAQRAGNLAIPLVSQLTALVDRRDRDAVDYVHWGATSQDIIDTALVLQMRDAFRVIGRDLAALHDAASALARRYAETPVVARTWMQHAIPTVVGLQFAGWADALSRHQERLREAERRSIVLQFGGAAGNLASLGDRGMSVAQSLSAVLDLPLPAMPWHAHRDRVVEVGSVLALLTGTLAKIARDIALQSQTEIGELAEPMEDGRGGSSTMPHKRNPIAASIAIAAGTRVPGLAATLFVSMIQEHERGLGGWQAEWETVPEITRLTAGALHHLLKAVGGLRVESERMRDNLEASNGLIYSEAVATALATRVGRREARRLVDRAAARAAADGRHLLEVLTQDATVTGHLDAAALSALFDARAPIGASRDFIDRGTRSGGGP
jgi:3-carboxy-cis,cis-muconate cycloisomerase